MVLVSRLLVELELPSVKESPPQLGLAFRQILIKDGEIQVQVSLEMQMR